METSLLGGTVDLWYDGSDAGMLGRVARLELLSGRARYSCLFDFIGWAASARSGRGILV